MNPPVSAVSVMNTLRRRVIGASSRLGVGETVAGAACPSVWIRGAVDEVADRAGRGVGGITLPSRGVSSAARGGSEMDQEGNASSSGRPKRRAGGMSGANSKGGAERAS